MKRFKKILILLILLLLGVGCNFDDAIDKISDTVEGERIKLNIEQSDLIASFTNNEKYLNKDLFKELNILDDEDLVNIIITLNDKGLMDSYGQNNYGFLTIGEFADSRYANSEIKTMAKDQEEVINELISKGYIESANHSYTTLFNGFSAKTTYGKLKELEKAGYDFNITISEVYAMPEYTTKGLDSYEAVVNYVDVYGTGIFDSSDCGYDGSNTSVAILDSGFDIHHTVFQDMPKEQMITMDDVQSVLYETKAYGYHKNIKTQDVYVNAKIPFAYDYADKDTDVAPYDSDHGTHVAGIIGGHDEVVTGVAVNTQLVLMKVFGDVNNGAIQEDILAALEDAILLGVDAINLSLGTSCGFARSSDEEEINVVYDKIEEAGIALVVAASNDYSSGYGGENSNTNKASNPDSATVGSPGSYKSTFAVASISGVKSKYIVAEDGYTFFFNNANDNAGEPYDFYEMLFEKVGTSRNVIKLEYVTVPGVGKKVNYSNIDVEGKIALVKRGETSFEEKSQIALSEGAIGCIIYNNVAGDVFMNAGAGLKIALCSLSKDDGEYLAQKGTGTLIFDKSYLAGPFMSEFSSWGPVSDLSLKPEITAHGGSILSAVPGGGYDEISGTSMACPNLCGVVILIRQALKERYKDQNLTTIELNDLANQLLMSTGTIILDEQGNPYSPRKQGAGLGNLKFATETLAYLSVEGNSKTKIECKDDPEETGVYNLKFDINNVSDKSLKYAIGDYTMTESLSTADPIYVAEKAYMLNPDTEVSISGNGTIDGDVITVDANSVVTVTYTIKLSKDDINYIRKSFVNGIYVEGYVKLDSMNEDNIDLSVPFLAFYGDWTVAPMFDKTYYEVESEAYNGAIDEEDKIKADYYATTPLGTIYHSYIIPLGSYVYEMDEDKYDKIPATEEHAAIGYSFEGINGITTVYAGLLRNAKKMTTTIKNKDTGEVVYSHLKYDEHKAYFGGSIIPGYDLINLKTEELGLQNNTQYTFTMLAELDYKDGGVNTNLNNKFEFSFYVDYEAPIIKDVEFYTKYNKTEKEYEYYLDAYIYDNHYTQSVRPFTIFNDKFTPLTEYAIPVYGDKGGISKVTIEITDYLDLLEYGQIDLEEGSPEEFLSICNGFGLLVDDYALNQNYSFISLPGTSTDIKFKEGSYSSVTNNVYQYIKDLRVDDELDLIPLLETTDETIDSNPDVQKEYFASLEWKSSDENVIKVNDGKIEAVGKGTATITVSNVKSNGEQCTISLRIRVRDKINDSGSSSNKLTDINFLYFDTLKAFEDGPETSEIGETGQRVFFTEKPIISCYPSEQVKIGYEIEPWNLKNCELVWSSTNEKVATVDSNGVVTALKEGNATITLKVKVNGKLSTMLASAKVSVKNEFIVEGNTLIAYKGLGGDVVIPDDEGILYIGAFAFSLYTTDYEQKIEEDDYDAAKTPESNDTVKSVVIPANVLEVQKYAFYNCSALEKVTFLKEGEDTCSIIRDHAFANDKKLADINLDDVNVIGKNAFMNCEGLTNINVSKVFAMGAGAFRNCINIDFVDLTALRNAGKEVFSGCTALKTIKNDIFTNFSEGMFKDSGLTEIDYMADRIPSNCFNNCNSLEKVNIVNDIVYVGKSAFYGCDKLTEVKFNAGCEFIYENAFEKCNNLHTVYLPNSSVEIESGAFNDCIKLEKVVFDEKTIIADSLENIFLNCDKLFTFEISGDNYVVDGPLLLSKDKQTIVFAAPGYDYGNYNIPQSIVNIADGAFSGLKTLKSLVIGNNVKTIGKHSFNNCANLETITLPNDIVIGEYAFSNCSTLNKVNNFESIKVFNAYVFMNTGLTEIVLNDVEVYEGAFKDCSKLTKVTVNINGNIGKAAFMNCNNLTEIDITATTIEDSAFIGCAKLSTVKLTNVTSIGNRSFMGCVSLNSFVNSVVEHIGDFAFCDCKNIETLDLPAVKSIGKYAFSTSKDEQSNKLVNLVFTDSLEEIGAYAFYLSPKLTNVTVGDNLKTIGEAAFSYCSKLEEFNSTSTVRVIDSYTFNNNLKLHTVKLNGINYVKEGAFFNCPELSQIDLTNVIEIETYGFYNNTALTEANLVNLKVLGNAAFNNCTNLQSVNVPVVEVIGFQSLSFTGITEIKLPSTVTLVEATAFTNNKNHVAIKNMDGKDTGKINDYLLLDEGVLYSVNPNGKYTLTCYPTAKENIEYEVLFNTVRIDDYAGAYNKNIKKLIFPDTLKLIGNMCFNECIDLNTIEFKSTVAPVLEGTIISDIMYEDDTEAFKVLNKFFQLNGYYPLYYGHFKGLVGVVDKLDIILPANDSLTGYDSFLYKLYFNVDSAKKSEYVGLNEKSIDYLNKVSLVPEEVLLSHGDIIIDAITAYNVLDQDLTKYGYSQEYLDDLYNNLISAKEKWDELKDSRISRMYQYLIDDIKELGNKFDYTKINEYYEIVKAIDRMDKEDERYIDTTNVDSFKDELDEYFKDLNEDINTITSVSTLPTNTVNKVGLAVAAAGTTLAILSLAVVFIKRRFF